MVKGWKILNARIILLLLYTDLHRSKRNKKKTTLRHIWCIYIQTTTYSQNYFHFYNIIYSGRPQPSIIIFYFAHFPHDIALTSKRLTMQHYIRIRPELRLEWINLIDYTTVIGICYILTPLLTNLRCNLTTILCFIHVYVYSLAKYLNKYI